MVMGCQDTVMAASLSQPDMLLRKLSNPAWQAWLACILLPINTRLDTAYMPTHGSSRRMSYQQE
eukprot:570784-Pelagomonas_calceolata.AAC.1